MLPGVSDVFNTGGGDMALDFGSAQSGGPVSFGNISGPNVGGRSTDWLLSSRKGDKTPIFIGAGLASILVVGLVVYLKAGK